MTEHDLYFFVAIEPHGGSMPELDTIKVVNPDGEGFMIINAEDFNPKLHTKWEARRPKKESQLKTTETSEGITQSNDPVADVVLARINELEGLYKESGWRSIADLAESMGIEKPPSGWRDAIVLIAEAEKAREL
jgi:hypothetical protein